MVTYRPRVRVTIRLAAYGEEIDVSNDLVNLATSKVYGRAAGGWQFLLPYRHLPKFANLLYSDVITPDDLVVIDIDAGDGRGYERVMVGLVNRVARTFAGGGPEGIPHRAVKISGLDLGKLLFRHNCGWVTAPRRGNELPPDILMLSRNIFFTGTPKMLARSIFEDLFLADVWQWVDNFTFNATTDDNWELYNWQVFHSTGPVWNAMKQVANEPWNTLTTETVSDLNKRQLEVRLEKTPIREDGKLAHSSLLPISPAEVIEEDLGVCDDERVTYFWFRPKLTIAGISDEVPVLHALPELVYSNEDEIAHHGTVFHTVDCDFAMDNMSSPYEPAGINFVNAAKARGKVLWERVKDNHKLESGSLKVHIAPWVRAGSGIVLTDTKKEYFVEQVDHFCQFGPVPIFTTTAYVTRGQKAGRIV